GIGRSDIARQQPLYAQQWSAVGSSSGLLRISYPLAVYNESVIVFSGRDVEEGDSKKPGLADHLRLALLIEPRFDEDRLSRRIAIFENNRRASRSYNNLIRRSRFAA